MNHCTECGEALKENTSFCTNCGTQQKQVAPEKPEKEKPLEPVQPNQEEVQPRAEISPEQTTRVKKQPKSGKPMSKKNKILIGSIIGVVVLLFIGYKGLDSHYDPMKKLAAMDEALVAGDVDEFLSYIDFDEKAFLDKETYVDFLKDYEWDSVRDQYQSIVENDSGLSGKIDELGSGLTLFTVKPQKHLLGLFKSFDLQAEPAKVSVESSMDDAELVVRKQTEKFSSNEVRDLLFYPGVYEYAAKAENDFGEFKYEDELEIGGQEERELYLEFDGNSYSVSTNQLDATLFVNDKDTGDKLGDIDFIGPFPSDSKVKLHAEWKSPDGDVLESETVTQGDADVFGTMAFMFDEDVLAVGKSSEEPDEPDDEDDEDDEDSDSSEEAGLDLDSDEADTEARDLVTDFRDAYEGALNSKDYSMIEPYLLKGGHAAKDLKEYIGDLKDTAYDYDFTLTEVNDVTKKSDEEMEVITREKFVFTNHLDEKVNYDREKVYTLKLDGDELKIEYIDYVETNRDKE